MTISLITRTILATLISTDSPSTRSDALLALLWGLTLTLCVTGYTFGQSNHHVYLLDALYAQHPENLRRDWFTTHTLQYHVLYTWLVVALQKLNLLSAGFFILYLALAALMHGAWWSIVCRVGGGVRAYLISVLIYHISGGGLGLGVYQFLQDGSFLPSNISAVAALMALAFWLNRKLLPASICTGVAGLFHLNYSLLMIAFWGFFSLLSLWRSDRQSNLGRFALATGIAMVPCLFNVGIAAKAALAQTDKIPIDQFVALYVKLRHPHHYDAMSWPLALWISFLWPIPFALYAMRRLPASRVKYRLGDAFYTVIGIQLFALTFAGVFFLSETIIQLSLFRFSIFVKLISCILTGWLIERTFPRTLRLAAGGAIVLGLGLLLAVLVQSRVPASVPPPTTGLLIGAGTLCLILAVMLLGGRLWNTARWIPLLALPATLYLALTQRLGIQMPGEANASMIQIADWARDNTPADSLFLVPPGDSAFRLEAQRSSVIGFKHVPQLSGELVEWKRRLDRVLNCDILTLPRPMSRTLEAMDRRYAQLPPEHLASVAEEYGCDYILSSSRFDAWSDRLEYATPDGHYWLYRLHDRRSRS